VKNRAFHHRFQFALSGIHQAWQHEKSLRTQGYASLGLIPFMLWLQPAPLWWALIGIMTVLVLAAELFNTSLEHLADRMHPGIHPAIKMAKDCSAGAVLVLSIGALWVAAWMVIDTLFIS